MIASVLLSGCFGRHSIKVVSRKELVDTCPRSAKAGETVRVTTAVVTDGDLYLNSTDGTEIKKIKDGVFEFVMPDHDIELKITVIANGMA